MRASQSGTLHTASMLIAAHHSLAPEETRRWRSVEEYPSSQAENDSRCDLG